MPIVPGSRLGPYEILSPLGAGGMGEVYRARDTRLDRDVAIKVLPALFAQDPERLARFEREAKLLATLNHPGIAHVYGFETAALPDGGQANLLAMELVPGEDLAARLARGPIPVEEAVEIARQITEALEEAHEKGIVHRDLKPANVKLTPDGKVKVLDFGLAKEWAGDAGSATSSADFSQSPTLAHTGTQAGLILGTAAYMSPEQARGKAVDRRSDIWAFGVLLFEMLTARRLFEGETVSDTLAAVLRQEVPWSALPAETPARVQRLLRRCLERDPKLRLRDVGEARIALGEASAREGNAGAETAARHPPLWRQALPWAVAVAGVLLAATALWRPAPRPASPARTTRTSVELGADAWLALSWGSGPAAILSPDGAMLAFVGRSKDGEPRRLYLRRLDQLQAVPLSGTEGAQSPFFSPDGQWIAFFADEKLKRVPLAGGSPVVLAEADQPSGGSWSDEGWIVFSSSNPAGRSDLFRLPASGGAVDILKKSGDAANENDLFPEALPGGRALLLTARKGLSFASLEEANVVVQRLPNGPRKVIVRGGYHGRYVPSGHVLFVRAGTPFAVPFDLERLEVKGAEARVVERLVSGPLGAGAQFSVSGDGTLAYLPGSPLEATTSTIQWLDESGRLSPLLATPGRYDNLRFSPDGARLAFQLADEKTWDVWAYEWKRKIPTRLTFSEVTGPSWLAWSPDGGGLAFTSRRGAKAGDLFWKRADGRGDVQLLSEGTYLRLVRSWHASGRYLAVTEVHSPTRSELMILPVESDSASGFRSGRATSFAGGFVGQAAFSPDGRWLAYFSTETGRSEVYVRPFPVAAGQWQVSSDGGTCPIWSPNGREIFYLAPDSRLMVASYSAQDGSFHVGTRRPWSETRMPPCGGTDRTFDLHPDGKRFAVLEALPEAAETRHRSVVLVQNFFDELRRLAPPK